VYRRWLSTIVKGKDGSVDEKHPIAFVHQVKLAAADRDRIVGGNAARLLRL